MVLTVLAENIVKYGRNNLVAVSQPSVCLSFILVFTLDQWVAVMYTCSMCHVTFLYSQKVSIAAQSSTKVPLSTMLMTAGLIQLVE